MWDRFLLKNSWFYCFCEAYGKRTVIVRVEFVEKTLVLLTFLKIEVTAAYGDRTGIVRVEYDLVNKSRCLLFLFAEKTNPCVFLARMENIIFSGRLAFIPLPLNLQPSFAPMLLAKVPEYPRIP